MREIKQCLFCGDDFTQGKPPKAIQVYCRYACYLAAIRGGEAIKAEALREAAEAWGEMQPSWVGSGQDQWLRARATALLEATK